MNRSILTLVLYAGLVPTASAAEGVIKVSVTDQVGNPIQGALVRADAMGNSVMASIVPECLTDALGKCSCMHLTPGEYTVNAGKESDGYPNMFIPLYRHGAAPRIVAIRDINQVIEVSLSIGPKAASVELLVIDAATGIDIKSPTVILRRTANPSDFLSTLLDSHSKILIPADDPVVIEVNADGYRPWHSETTGSSRNAGPFKLHSTESLKLTVKLQHSL
jgi:hypothetical protein